MKAFEIIQELNTFAPPIYQENYDNSGLLVGSYEQEVSGILITLDCTEKVIEEAITKGCNFIIAHHPLIFKPLKRITHSSYIERTIITAIKNDIGIFALHTNLDNILEGVNGKIADILKLKNREPLAPKNTILKKIVFFSPENFTQKVSQAIFNAGGGQLGNYTECCYVSKGTGSFKPNSFANPAIGEKGRTESVNEDKVEIIFPIHLEPQIIKALKKNHPYEEPAFDIYQLQNTINSYGSGLIGELENPMNEKEFLFYLKETMNLTLIKHTPLRDKIINTVALCGGSGSFLITHAKNRKADIFISSDIKYHEFFDADEELIIADINHYEAEVFTKDLIFERLIKKFANIALVLSNVKTNPISYL